MTDDFVYDIPTRLLFGPGALDRLGGETFPGKKALLVMTGGKSAKATGAYDRLLAQLAKAGVAVAEFPKVEANPLRPTVMVGAALMFVIVAWKWLLWLYRLPKSDKRLILRGLPTRRTLQAGCSCVGFECPPDAAEVCRGGLLVDAECKVRCQGHEGFHEVGHPVFKFFPLCLVYEQQYFERNALRHVVEVDLGDTARGFTGESQAYLVIAFEGYGWNFE